jgi:hypothetical protein
VTQVAVVPVPDELLGERVCAYAVTRDGTELSLDERDQGVTGGGLELPYVPVGEGAQERAERRGRVHAGEQRRHPAVPGDVDVVDAVRAGEHPRDDRGELARRVRPGVTG